VLTVYFLSELMLHSFHNIS